MKELLHSKLFRRNLSKWLFMYVGVLGLLTCVITYSKYISNMHSNVSDARAAKFNVIATFDGNCAGNDKYCQMGSFRPTEEFSYYFTVDTRELEVKTFLVTNIIVEKHFKNIKLYDVTSGNDVEFTNYQIENNTLSIQEELNVDDMYVRKYKLTCVYDNPDDEGYKATQNYNDAVVIGYSALQRD